MAGWAADCAERVLALFEAVAPDDPRPRESIARTRAFARGELEVAGEIRHRFSGAQAARDVGVPSAAAAARAAGQAAAVAHMGAHALGAAAYAATAAGLAAGDPSDGAPKRFAGSSLTPPLPSGPRSERFRGSARTRQARSGQVCSRQGGWERSSASSRPG